MTKISSWELQSHRVSEHCDIGTHICLIPVCSVSESGRLLPQRVQLLHQKLELCRHLKYMVKLWPWALPAHASGCLSCLHLTQVVRYRLVSKQTCHSMAQVDSYVWGLVTWHPTQRSQCHGVCFPQSPTAGRMMDFRMLVTTPL